jgi:cyclohexanecarboxylate-CoA ligase
MSTPVAATRLTPELVASYEASGAWTDEPLHAALAAAAAARPDGLAAASVDGTTAEVRERCTYAELDALADRLAGGLADLGVGPGDGVAVMVPNRLEFGALVFAISRLGAVYTGIPLAAGAKDAAFMLRRTGARAIVVAARREGPDHVALARRLRDEVERLEHVVVLDGPAADDLVAYDALAAAAPPDRTPDVDAGSLAHIGFTSGTTGEPKGVMNTHQTLSAVYRHWIEHVGGPATLGEPAVNLIASPVGHHTGYLWGTLMSAHLAAAAVYVDRWVPEVAAEVMAAEGVTTMTGAPTFLQDLVRVPGLDAARVPALRIVTLAGAPIPRELVPRAAEQLGAFVCPAWGMTEYGIGVSAHPDLPPERLAATDGATAPGCEARVTAAGEPLGAGETGDLEIRGPGLFLGYHERPDFTAEAIVDGWFSTGDLARIDDDGLISLQGRTKDIVIRGGENIPVNDVENTLYRHPRVLDAAVIGVPDERLGERACAVLVVHGAPLTVAEVAEFCLSEGLSKHYLPERVEVVDALPKTMSGKVRKVELRERYGR